jgi:hypothetical protein
VTDRLRERFAWIFLFEILVLAIWAIVSLVFDLSSSASLLGIFVSVLLVYMTGLLYPLSEVERDPSPEDLVLDGGIPPDPDQVVLMTCSIRGCKVSADRVPLTVVAFRGRLAVLCPGHYSDLIDEAYP